MNAPQTPPITVGIEEPAPAGFEVVDEDSAAWAVSVIRARRRHLADLEEQYIARATKAKRELERAEQFFMPLLERWARSELRNQGARAPRHVDVATGRLQFRKREGGIKISDDAAVMEFARKLEETAPGVIVKQVKEGIDRERLKAGLAALFSGELAKKLMELAPIVNPDERMGLAMDAAIKALPAGVTFVEPGDDFRIVSGGDR